MKANKSIPEALAVNADPESDLVGRLFEETKVDGKIVMFEGSDKKPSILINVDNKLHVSVRITKAKAIQLHEFLTGILRLGKIV